MRTSEKHERIEDLEGAEPCLTLRQETLPILRPLFPLYAGAFSLQYSTFMHVSHKAGPVLQEFGPVLWAGFHPSTSGLQAPHWGCGWLLRRLWPTGWMISAATPAAMSFVLLGAFCDRVGPVVLTPQSGQNLAYYAKPGF